MMLIEDAIKEFRKEHPEFEECIITTEFNKTLNRDILVVKFAIYKHCSIETPHHFRSDGEYISITKMMISEAAHSIYRKMQEVALKLRKSQRTLRLISYECSIKEEEKDVNVYFDPTLPKGSMSMAPDVYMFYEMHRHPFATVFTSSI